MELSKTIILNLSAILLFLVGIMRLFQPVKTYLKNSGIQLPNDVSLLNEIRGISAVMLLAGLLIFCGNFFANFKFTAHFIAVLIYMGFLLGRLISFQKDGKPSKEIVQGMFFEIMLGSANIFCIILS